MPRYKKALLEAFKPHFKEHGFTKKDATWHLQKTYAICVFNVQTSQWSELYYFNAGIYFRSLGNLMTPAEPHCHIRTRIPDSKFHEASRYRANELSNFENQSLDINQQIIELTNLIYPLVFDWFERFYDLDSARKRLSGIDRPWFMISKQVWPFLNVPFPE